VLDGVERRKTPVATGSGCYHERGVKVVLSFQEPGKKCENVLQLRVCVKIINIHQEFLPPEIPRGQANLRLCLKDPNLNTHPFKRHRFAMDLQFQDIATAYLGAIDTSFKFQRIIRESPLSF
jgi:hypothetical protein